MPTNCPSPHPSLSLSLSLVPSKLAVFYEAGGSRARACRFGDILIFPSNQSTPSAEERKLALTGQVSFALVHPYYLTPSPSRKTSFRLPLSLSLFLSLSLSSLFISFERFADPFRFPLFYLLARSSRPAGSRYYPIATLSLSLSLSVSPAYPAFFRKTSLFRPNRAIAQMLTRPAKIAPISPSRYVHLLHLQSETLSRR